MSDAPEDDGDDAEFRAMAMMLAAINLVHSHEGKLRVLRYVLDRLQIDSSDLGV